MPRTFYVNTSASLSAFPTGFYTNAACTTPASGAKPYTLANDTIIVLPSAFMEMNVGYFADQLAGILVAQGGCQVYIYSVGTNDGQVNLDLLSLTVEQGADVHVSVAEYYIDFANFTAAIDGNLTCDSGILDLTWNGNITLTANGRFYSNGGILYLGPSFVWFGTVHVDCDLYSDSGIAGLLRMRSTAILEIDALSASAGVVIPTLSQADNGARVYIGTIGNTTALKPVSENTGSSGSRGVRGLDL